MSNRKKRLNKKALAVVICILIVFELVVFFAGYNVGVHKERKAFNKTESLINTKNTDEEIETLAPTDVTEAASETPKETKDTKEKPTEPPKKENLETPVPQSKVVDAKAVQDIMDKMSVSDMIYQMLFVTPESITNMGEVIAAGDTTKNALKTYPVGGIVYFSQNFKDRQQTIDMIKNTQSFSKIPLFIGVDEEGGRVARLGSNPVMGTTSHPPMKEIGASGDYNKAYQIGTTLAKDLSQIGFNVDFAPDADVIINQNNTEIGDRSFGSDPNVVAEMVKNVTNGLQDNGVSATLKHFPGHGSTYVDSHTGRSESNRTLDEMRQNEFLPFKSASNADFIMVSHMTPVNAVKEKVPASISKEIITDILIGELKYEGIIITDSFSMGAIVNEYSVASAAIKAVNAGVDMILMPKDVAGTHNAILKAVESGDISKERIEKSVRKILSLKYEKGMLE